MPALTYYWRIAPIHVGPGSFFIHTALNALFEPVANSLGAATQRIERDTQMLSHRQPAVDLLAFLVAVILQDQLPAFDRQFLQALLETVLFFVFLFRIGRDERGGRQFFKVRPSTLGAFQLFEQDQTSHAVAICGEVA